MFESAYFFAWAVAFVFGVAWQKFSQAFVATLLGDPTPRKEGRLTLNPFVHHEALGLIFAFLIGLGTFLLAWGKPLKINTYAIRGRKLGYFIVSIVQPLSNLLLAFLIWLLAKNLIVSGTGGRFNLQGADFLPRFLAFLIVVNLYLVAFNLIPLYPLGGLDILRSILPDSWNERLQFLEEYGLLIIIVVVFLLPFFTLGRFNPLFDFVITPLVTAMLQLITAF